MDTKRFTLSKEERLSQKRYIDLLFARGQSFIAFPLRVVFLPVDGAGLPQVSILISVSKKKFKHAVKRNLIKRQIRESYRIQKYTLIDPLQEQQRKMLIAFLYLDKEIRPFVEMKKAMEKALLNIQKKG